MGEFKNMSLSTFFAPTEEVKIDEKDIFDIQLEDTIDILSKEKNKKSFHNGSNDNGLDYSV